MQDALLCRRSAKNSKSSGALFERVAPNTPKRDGKLLLGGSSHLVAYIWGYKSAGCTQKDIGALRLRCGTVLIIEMEHEFQLHMDIPRRHGAFKQRFHGHKWLLKSGNFTYLSFMYNCVIINT